MHTHTYTRICMHTHIYIHIDRHLDVKVDILKINFLSHSKPSYSTLLSKSIKLFSFYALPSGILVLFS